MGKQYWFTSVIFVLHLLFFFFSRVEKNVPRSGEEELTSPFRRQGRKKFPGSVVCFSLPAVPCRRVLAGCPSAEKKRSFPVDKLHIQSNNTRLCLRMVGSTTPSIDLPCHNDNVNLFRNVPKCLNIKYCNPVWESREVLRFVTDDCMCCYPQH